MTRPKLIAPDHTVRHRLHPLSEQPGRQGQMVADRHSVWALPAEFTRRHDCTDVLHTHP
ncbi:hypothetical protein ACFWWT_42765 [Streptomyces sp. NPDC058676]|uniref:hypothetical protein n=1 Tax=unclassified Streptomyces TaxID=2593676 RepID=UPI003656633D